MHRHTIFAPKGRGHFIERLGELRLTIGQYLDEEKAEGRLLRFAKIFLSDAQNQYEDLTHSALFADILAHVPTSVIEQPPLDGSKISIMLKTSEEEIPFLFHSIRLTEEETRGANSYIQTMLIFNKYLEQMKALGLTLKEHCVRTWIYVADIDVNYEGMVRARNDIFRSQGLTPDTHFIASTGIGGFSQTRSDLHTDQGQTFFISGTASIDKHGKALYVGDIQRQTGRLLENISALLHDGGATMRDVQYFYVYLRDPSDRDVVESFLRKAYPDIPYVLLQGKVCRPEWLVEMECVAMK